ncbi:uncharacterized protein K02A2.6-like [Corticium candelabrum]|uniref:uncharacterized protein K02A2.6-like n=1 Tax=Corticium candelabrum TaxID=121492 RepID=UPI002E26D864|nr:uncharacterized protein K02A2.6-like [Corticium candelabrum]
MPAVDYPYDYRRQLRKNNQRQFNSYSNWNRHQYWQEMLEDGQNKKDSILSRVQYYVHHGWPNKPLIEALTPYWRRASELSIEEGCVLWGSVIVPPQGQQRVLEELHAGHPGVAQMKGLARTIVWWPGLDGDIERKVQGCSSCQETRNAPPKAPFHPWCWPHQPWMRVHVDYAGPLLGKMFLLLTHLKWIEVEPVESVTTKTTLEKLRKIFSTHGIPDKLLSGNGSVFTSQEFTDFVKSNGINHIKTATYHPSSNGLAERAVQVLKKGLSLTKQGTLTYRLTQVLFSYQITPHSTTGISPVELMQITVTFRFVTPQLGANGTQKTMATETFLQG